MPRTNEAVATAEDPAAPAAQAAQADGTAAAPAADGTAAPAAAKPKRARSNRIYVVVPMTAEMKQLVVDQAKAQDRAVGIVARDLLADKLGVTVPLVVASRPKKYATKDEAKAARSSALKERNALVKQLLAQLKAGNIVLPPVATNGEAGAEGEPIVTAPEPEAVPA